MPSITITERDFLVLACAASEAQRTGDVDQAKSLDRLARMSNAALTRDSSGAQAGRRLGISAIVRWQDMPSTINPRAVGPAQAK
jgi:hypothetical protein